MKEPSDRERLEKYPVEYVDGLPVRRVPKKVRESLHRDLATHMLEGGVAWKPAGKRRDYDGKMRTYYVPVQTASKTSAFEEYRWYLPADAENRIQPKTLGEYYARGRYRFDEDADDEERQLLSDPNPRGGRGYTIQG